MDRHPLPAPSSSLVTLTEVPLEIWGEIFLNVLSSSSLKVTTQLPTLCLVCREWRDVALAMPRLWPVLQVDVGCRLTCASLKNWLLRSRCLPKHVTFTESWTSHNVSLPHREMARFLVEGPVLDRLSLRFYSMECFQTIVDSVESFSPALSPRAWDSLRSLTLNIGHWGDGPLRNDCLQHIPSSLTNLSLVLPWWDNFQAHESPLPCISHPYITSLDLECNWPPSWILETVASCTSLDTLSLRIKGCPRTSDGPWFDGNGRCVLPNLRTLRLRQPYHYVRYDRILRHLSLPSLVDLDVSLKSDAGDEEYEPDWALRDYAKDIGLLAQRSGGLTGLCRFRLHWPYPIGPAELSAFFQHISSIVHLTLDQTDLHPSVFYNNFEFLPQLRALELLGTPSSFDYDILTPFFERCKSRQGRLALLRGSTLSTPPS